MCYSLCQGDVRGGRTNEGGSMVDRLTADTQTHSRAQKHTHREAAQTVGKDEIGSPRWVAPNGSFILISFWSAV